ncbi:MAG: ATP-binding protein [Draconibacterium sp.]|nr:ATP-binding protein [Draconibacterium sp.]
METRPPKILVIKSDVTELKKVEDFLINIFNEYKLEKKYFNKIYLCISEAVLNSIQHGNKNDLDKEVSIILDCNDEEISIKIEDEGDGFDFKNLQNPILKENINKESGRGIFIIKNLTDTIEFNEKGNQVQFKIECK